MFHRLTLLSLVALASAPAAAATYSAKPVAATENARFAARDILWNCGASGCTGATANSRPLVLCQGLAKQTGALESFVVNGRPISAEELGRCNASAPADRNRAVAANR